MAFIFGTPFMPLSQNKVTILTTKIQIQPDLKNSFADWQAKLNARIAAFPDFVSLEILSPKSPSQSEWAIIQRFYSPESLLDWRQSKERKELFEELKLLLNTQKPNAIQETEMVTSDLMKGGITEVFITQVSQEKESEFREWIAKIHQVEAKFPGFQGVYVQSPRLGQGKNWITLLQFDTPENLEHWLASSERQQLLNESKPLIASLESHRVISPYAAWFSSIAKKGKLPSLWKQTMTILLVLFPIVMLELKFLTPLTSHLGPSLSMFIGNAISVTLISWPMMPIAIRFLRWWLSPENHYRAISILGAFIVTMLYLLEIMVFSIFTKV